MSWDVIVIGGGAAGLMCAASAGKRGRSVLLLERAAKLGKKILISGGGRCNFTNVFASPQNYSSQNEHFCKSALARYTASDFIALVESYGIPYHEKKLGQLFCDHSARDIVAMLVKECDQAGVSIKTGVAIEQVTREEQFRVKTADGTFESESLVVATGGLSIPKMGATDFGYRLAKQFGLGLTKMYPALVPFTFSKKFLSNLRELSGVSIDTEVGCAEVSFRENLLFTHRGLSGPAILQVSTFWKPGDEVVVNLLPDTNLGVYFDERSDSPREVKNLIAELLPKRFVDRVFELWLPNKPLHSLSAKERLKIEDFFHAWKLSPSGTEGYRTAEVTAGGVDVAQISSKTFEAKDVPGLFFIGEVLDVTGWLGGYNFQWAWASGYCAGQYV